MNTKQKGSHAEAVVLSRLLKRGLSVSVCFGENDRYDMIVDTGTSLLRVQVKQAWPIRGGKAMAFNTKSVDARTTACVTTRAPLNTSRCTFRPPTMCSWWT